VSQGLVDSYTSSTIKNSHTGWHILEIVLVALKTSAVRGGGLCAMQPREFGDFLWLCGRLMNVTL